MYIINDYQLVTVASESYLVTESMGAKLPGKKLANILTALNQLKKLDCTEDQLVSLSDQFQIDLSSLKKILIEKLQILKPAFQQNLH